MEILKVSEMLNKRSAENEPLKVNEENNDIYLEGYFAVFDTMSEIWEGAFESIDQHAFDETMKNDIRALINHDTTLVLGRNTSGTLILTIDSHGLFGRIKINREDADAMNLYSRVKRGDVSGNSFGFNILGEETTFNENGTINWKLTIIDLKEVSVCTFPQYPETNIQARKKEVEQHEARKLETRKLKLKARLENVKNINTTKKA